MFASMLGFIIAGSVLLIMFFSGMIWIISSATSKFSNDDQKAVIEDNSIYHLKLNHEILEREDDNPLSMIDFGPFHGSSGMSLRKIISSIEYAADDDRIKGIYLEINHFSGGLAQLDEVREALIKFKVSGKWIVAYGESYSQGSYYLASVADHIYMFPKGDVYFKGLSSNVMYLKGALDKLDIEVQVIKGPDNIYKSAVEPITNTGMSDASRTQTEAYLSSIWTHWITGISAMRGISLADLNIYADSLRLRSAQKSVDLGFVDQLMYPDEVEDALKRLAEMDTDADLNLVSYSDYKNNKISTYPKSSRRGVKKSL